MIIGVEPYAAAIESMAEGVIVYDGSGQAVLVNRHGLELLGLSEAQVFGSEPLSDTWRPIGADGRRLRWQDLPLSVVLRTGEPVVNALMGVRRGDDVVWLSTNARTIVDDDGAVVGVVTSFRDATDVKVGREIDRAVRDLASRLVEAPLGSPTSVVEAQLATIAAVTVAERVVYVAIDREAGVASVMSDWSRTGRPFTRIPGGVPIDLLATLLGRLTRREIVMLIDRSELPDDRQVIGERLWEWGLDSAVAAPVVIDGSLSGFVVVGWSEPYDPDDRLVDFITVATELIAARLEREAVHEELQRTNASLDERVRQRSAELVVERERTRAIIDAIPDLMIELDPDGVFLNVHAPDPSMLALRPEDFLGRTIDSLLADEEADFLRPEFRVDIQRAIDRLRDAGGLEIVEYEMPIDASSHRFECRLVSKPDGGTLAVIRDITGAAERERALQEQSAKLSYANDELQRALQARDEFLASVSHELRTPLNAILGHTEMLLDEAAGPLTVQQQGSIRTIDSSGHHLLSLIEDLLDLSRMNAQMSSLDLHSVNTEELCRLAIELVRQRAVEKGVRLEFVDATNEATILVDERRVRQILLNLLDNAVKFTDPGGVVGLQVRKPDGSHVAFTVWDTGIGIAPEDQRVVFEPFSQVDTSLARRHNGSGLGLALVERLVSLHRGSIELESSPGDGSRFTVVLPISS